MEIKRKVVKFVSKWKNIAGGTVFARIEFEHYETEWLARSGITIQMAEIVSDSLFNKLRDKYL